MVKAVASKATPVRVAGSSPVRVDLPFFSRPIQLPERRPGVRVLILPTYDGAQTRALCRVVEDPGPAPGAPRRRYDIKPGPARPAGAAPPPHEPDIDAGLAAPPASREVERDRARSAAGVAGLAKAADAQA